MAQASSKSNQTNIKSKSTTTRRQEDSEKNSARSQSGKQSHKNPVPLIVAALVALALIASAITIVSTLCSDPAVESSTSSDAKDKNSSSKISIDYDEKTFEDALNQDEDTIGKIVSFKVREVHPDYVLGHNLWSGVHLNFVSPDDPGLKEGDTAIVKVTDVETSPTGSYIIYYEIIK